MILVLAQNIYEFGRNETLLLVVVVVLTCLFNTRCVVSKHFNDIIVKTIISI